MPKINKGKNTVVIDIEDVVNNEIKECINENFMGSTFSEYSIGNERPGLRYKLHQHGGVYRGYE